MHVSAVALPNIVVQSAPNHFRAAAAVACAPPPPPPPPRPSHPTQPSASVPSQPSPSVPDCSQEAAASWRLHCLLSQVGIVGLPNVGKSTLFNTITKMGIPAENFPFCTIDPNHVRPCGIPLRCASWVFCAWLTHTWPDSDAD